MKSEKIQSVPGHFLKKGVLALIWGGVLIFGITSFGQEKIKRFQIEIFGGYSFINPKDINAALDYNERYYNFYYREKYLYYQSVFGSAYNLTESQEGKYNRIKNALPVGLRLRYYLTPNLSFSLGAKYFSQKETSHVTDRYDIISTLPDSVHFYENSTRTITNSPQILSVEGWAPMVGILYRIPLSQAISMEGFFSVGYWSGKCRYMRTTINQYTDQYDYWEEQEYKYEIQGEGEQITWELGARLNVPIKGGMGLFVEGGFSYLNVSELKGPGKYEYWHQDQNSEKTYDLLYSWEGHWGINRETAERDWGKFQQDNPVNYYNETDTALEDFAMNLSGFQLRIGFFIRF